MFARTLRLLRSFLGASAVATSPLKAITGIVISLIIPYLLYAFLGGFGLALVLGGVIWLVWWMVKNK